MTKKVLKFSLIFLFLLIFIKPIFVLAQEECPPPTEFPLEIHFFYSRTCPHCAAEQEFLNEIAKRYSQVKINRYLNNDPKHRPLLLSLAEKHNAQRLIGLVPLTFVGEDFFIGFDSPDATGQEIEQSIQRQLANLEEPEKSEHDGCIHLPIIGEIEIKKYSLTLQAIILGFFDGFNVCSLGALVLILGLVLTLKSRRKILIFGGIFILTTALVYGLLILLWYKLFSLLSPYLRLMEVIIGLLGISAGIYFARQFVRFRKYGPACEAKAGQNMMTRFSAKIQTILKKSSNLILISLSIFLFAAIITIVEFPCSAVIPVFFAGSLAQANLNTFLYLLYIAIFVLFYMLDELIVFLIAVFTLKIRLASPRFIVWITLVEAIVLLVLGFYYLIGF